MPFTYTKPGIRMPILPCDVNMMANYTRFDHRDCLRHRNWLFDNRFDEHCVIVQYNTEEVVDMALLAGVKDLLPCGLYSSKPPGLLQSPGVLFLNLAPKLLCCNNP